jgi:hypothetical protein
MNDPRPNNIQVPSDALEMRAASQRERLHNSVSELRDHLDVKKTARTYVWRVSTGAALLALVLGYSLGGAFTE